MTTSETSRVPEIADRDYRDDTGFAAGCASGIKSRKVCRRRVRMRLRSCSRQKTICRQRKRPGDSTSHQLRLMCWRERRLRQGPGLKKWLLARRAARLRREDIQRRDEALRSAEKTAESAQARSINCAPLLIGNNERASRRKEMRP